MKNYLAQCCMQRFNDIFYIFQNDFHGMLLKTNHPDQDVDFTEDFALYIRLFYMHWLSLLHRKLLAGTAQTTIVLIFVYTLF